MRHIALGGLDVSGLGLGTMGMSAYYTGAGADDAESIRTIHRALDLGITFIDTAEVYGPTPTRNSSGGPSPTGATRWSWPPSSA
jgi:aryl-alcohol dehydrogenase-like predicted oxidoreductase